MNYNLDDSLIEDSGVLEVFTSEAFTSEAILVQSETLKDISLLKAPSLKGSGIRFRVSIAFENSGYDRCSYMFESYTSSYIFSYSPPYTSYSFIYSST